MKELNFSAVIQRSMAIADYYVWNFKWTPEQQSYLFMFAKYGDMIAPINDIARAFGKQQSTDGDKVFRIICSSHGYSHKSGKTRKKDISFICLYEVD